MSLAPSSETPTSASPGVSAAAEPSSVAIVGVIMGSTSDWETMQHAVRTLEQLGVPSEVRVVSAHRTPELLCEYARSAIERGLEAIIAGAGGAAHLPGMTASMTRLPVLGVPVESAALRGLDSLLSIVQMPGGVPVATFAIGKAGAINAALMASAIVGKDRPDVLSRLDAFRARQRELVLSNPDPRASPRGLTADDAGGAVPAVHPEGDRRR
jgi:5-(carboxyamino)imidazole ribonucleotide mutase